METVAATRWSPRKRSESSAVSSPAAPARFVVTTLIACIFLQRLAVPLGGSMKIPLATPLVLGAAAVELMAQRLVFSGRRTVIYCALATASLIPTALSAIFDLAPREGSVPSLVYGLFVTGFATLSFHSPMQEDRFYAFFTNCLAVVAVAGLIQFVAQFFGVLMFRFSGVLPDAWSLEPQFSTFQSLYYGSDIYRSNGFFLLEPSFLGQFMAIAMMMEILCRRRPAWLVLFGSALLAAASGTGILVLFAFAVSLMFRLGPRRAAHALTAAGVLALGLITVNLLLPQITETLLTRVGEFSQQDTSANQRFVAAFAIIGEVFGQHPWAILTGVGPGTSEHLVTSYQYLPNTATKYIVEYGILGFVLYLALVLSSERTYRQGILLLPLMVLLLFAGQNEQFSIVVFPVLLIVTVSRLE